VSEKEKNIETLNANVLTEKANVVKLQNEIKKLSADSFRRLRENLMKKTKLFKPRKMK